MKRSDYCDGKLSWNDPKVPATATYTSDPANPKLTGQLCEALEAKGLGARQLDLLFHRIDNRISPTCSARDGDPIDYFLDKAF